MANRTWTGAVSGDWGVVGNWLEGAVPVDGDSVYLFNNAVDITAGLNQSAVQPALLQIDQSYTGKIGTATTYLRIGPTIVYIGRPSANSVSQSGSTRLNLDFGSDAVSVNIVDSATGGADSGQPPIRLLGSSMSSVNINKGTVGIATLPTESAAMTNLSTDNQNGTTKPIVFVGAGATVSQANVGGGEVSCYGVITTLQQTGGIVSYFNDADIGSAFVDGGTLVFNGHGVSALKVGSNGTVDFSRDSRVKAVGTANIYKGGKINANNGVPLSITFSGGINVNRCKLDEVEIDFGTNFKITPAVVS